MHLLFEACLGEDSLAYKAYKALTDTFLTKKLYLLTFIIKFQRIRLDWFK